MDGAIAVYYRGRLITSEPALFETPVLRIQGARVNYRLPAPPPPVRPLPLELVRQRTHPRSLEDDIIRTPGPAPLPGQSHPWRKAIRKDVDQALRWRQQRENHAADKFTDRLNGQNH